MKKYGFFLFVLILACPGAYADRVSPEAAAECARAVFSAGATRSSSVNVKRVVLPTTRSSSSVENYYVFNNAPDGGFVIISADDAARPVLAWSEKGQFRPDDMPSNLVGWLSGLDRQFAHIRTAGIRQTEEGRKAWGALKSGGGAVITPVTLLTTALWGQGEPFNGMTPTSGEENCVTGCVQTAVAIMMKFFEYPGFSVPTRQMTKGYWVDNGWFAAILEQGSRQYAWNNMLMDYNGSYTGDEADAVARLMADLGIMQEAQYSLSATGAVTDNISDNLATYMGYSKAAECLYRDSYSTAEWTKILRGELDGTLYGGAGHPIVYSGASADGAGHCFIVDGYAKDDFFHINWGWYGDYNGFFAIDIFQSDGQGIGGNDGSAFSYWQDAQIGLVPDPDGSSVATPDYNMTLFGGFSLIDGGEISPSGTHLACFSNLINTGNMDFPVCILYVSRRDRTGGVTNIFGASLGAFYKMTAASYNLNISNKGSVPMLGDVWCLYYQPFASISGSTPQEPLADAAPVSFNPDKMRGEIPLIDAAYIIVKEDGYSAGEKFTRKIFFGRELPQKVTWYHNGGIAFGDIVLKSGTNRIEAVLDYAAPNCLEILEREIIVP